jgi:peptidoglycan/LPS O-acetylase OafA/YrhL
MRKEETRRTSSSGALSDPNHHLEALTALRLVAATWVVLFHYKATIEAWVPGSFIVMPFINVGFLGVDLFFCLSGFVLCHRYLSRLGAGFSRREIGTFLWLRLARIYPVHLFMLGVLSLLIVWWSRYGSSGADFSQLSVNSFFENVILVHAWFNQPLSWNIPAWSISMEWAAYLLFPFLALFLTRLMRTRGWVGSVTLIWILLAVAISLVGIGRWNIAAVGDGFFGVGALRILTGFVSGCILFVLSRHVAVNPKAIRTLANRWLRGILLLALASAIGILGTIPPNVQGAPQFGADGAYPRQAWLIVPGLWLLVALVSFVGLDGRRSRFWNSRRAILGGLISYSLYMTHTIVIAVMGGVKSEGISRRLDIADSTQFVQTCFTLVVLAMCYGIAILVWKVIEEPARLLMRRRVRNVSGSRYVELGG